jgi:hypothetical protein
MGIGRVLFKAILRSYHYQFQNESHMNKKNSLYCKFSSFIMHQEAVVFYINKKIP